MAGKQADGMSVGTLIMANRGSLLNNLIDSVNSFRYVHYETYQCRSGAVRHGAEHERVRRHLAPVR
jgi:hypothetical protein